MHRIDRLIKGFKSFHSDSYDGGKGEFARLIEKGQKPQVAVVACSDSRVDPAILFQTAPGDLFVIRNVANLVPPMEQGGTYHGTSAALEFAVTGLGVSHILVFGHARCGGIRALMENAPETEQGFVGSWVKIAETAKRRVLATLSSASIEEKACACEKEAVMVSLENLMTFPFVRDRVEEGTLKLHGWYFDMENGRLFGYSSDESRFVELQ